MYNFFTDNGPDYSCPKCGADTIGEIGHECGEIILEKKKCSLCKEEKILSEFKKDKNKKRGYSYLCKKCSSGFNKKWRERNPEKVKKYNKEYWAEFVKNRGDEKYNKWRSSKTHSKHKIGYREEFQEKWKSILKIKYGDPPVCQVCGKILDYFTKDLKTIVNWDHRNGGNETIKNEPSRFLHGHAPTLKNIEIWDSCNFGILCPQCNKRLPTQNRVLWLNQIAQYINAIGEEVK